MLIRRLLTASALLVTAATLLTAPVQADESAVPSAGVVQLDGRGFGHGRGLSQWGARGAATSGLTWEQIVAFYYPGTTRFQQGTTAIRVWITADQDGTTQVVPQTGLTVRSGSGSAVLPAGAQYDGWRTRRAGAGFVLERLDGATWYPHATAFALSGAVSFTAPSQLVRLVLPDGTRQDLRGEIRAVTYGTGSRSVAVMPMESYLRAVVPAEMPASWESDALRSQAVAARSYAARLREDTAPSATYDTCDTTSCQVFAGTARYRADGSLISAGEHPSTDGAITATSGIVLRYTPAGTATPRVAFTQFSASNGGWTVAGGSAHPYLVAKADPYDGVVPSTAHAWTATVTAATIEQRQPSIGTLRRIDIQTRDGNGDMGGRILSATVTGTAGSVVLTGTQLRTTMGTKSEWFEFVTPAFSRDWNGDETGDVLGVDAAGRLLLYPGNRTGSFTTSRQVGSGWSGLDLVTQAGDWDGDGRGDIVGRHRSDGALRLYRGNGTGGFISNQQIGNGWHGFDAIVAPGDWNGDGAPDLLARVESDGRLLMYPGTGSGGFGSSTAVGSGWGALDLVTAVGDWNGDGHADLVARRTDDGSLWLYPGDGAGSFQRPARIGTGWTSMNRLLGPGDWNGDGNGDILARHGSGALYLYPGNGTGGFGRSRQIGSGWSGLSLVG